MLGDVAAGEVKFQGVLAGQTIDELLVCIRFGAAQLVIEMDDGENDAEFVAQFCQQAKQRDRINPAGNCDADAVAGMKQFVATKVG
jgi:hypothetical protein